MATKKFLIEVEEGNTRCDKCPFDYMKCARESLDELDCNSINLATMKIKELEDSQCEK